MHPLPREAALAFGPFQLYAAQKLLLRRGERVPLGGRAIDLLLALVRQPGQLLSQRALVAAVWPDTIVEDSSLRVHVAALRRALRDGAAGASWISNVPGRGYSFLAPVAVVDEPPAAVCGPDAPRKLGAVVRLSPIFGRAHDIDCVRERLRSHRLVTIAGPGGVGKSTLATAVAEKQFPGGVFHVDLRAVHDLAGLGDAFDRMASTQAVLLILDNCEHVVKPAVMLAEQLLCRVACLSILATSREPLLADGECVCRIAPLAYPPPGLKAPPDAHAYPALQLFLDRACRACSALQVDDANMHIAAAICRLLDGLPLALALAAASVPALGLRGLLDQLGSKRLPDQPAHRHGPAIHASLAACYRWSYAGLPDDEQRVLQRLAMLCDSFSLAAACNTASDIGMPAAQVRRALMALVAKSLVMAELNATGTRYRLLHTVRAFTAIHVDSLAPGHSPLQDEPVPWHQ
jgi:predicted ATPase/DNA-binding winged helix-turn-helix (wHTH) protein